MCIRDSLLTRSLASAHRISEVLDEPVVLASPSHAEKEVRDGSVEFEHVSFKYDQSARTCALSGVNLKIRAGQTIGILGGTGSAKSTLVQLIPRLYDVTDGTVRVGGVDVRNYDLQSLRDAVGIVLQKNVLFSGTVRENLLWGNSRADDEALWAACRAACADEFLLQMPNLSLIHILIMLSFFFNMVISFHRLDALETKTDQQIVGP